MVESLHSPCLQLRESELVGVKFKKDGRDKDGVDFVGIIKLCFDQLGISGNIDFSSSENFFENNEDKFNVIENKKELKQGDIVCFSMSKTIACIGVMIDKFRFIHNFKNSKTMINRLENVKFNKYFYCGVRNVTS